MNATQFFDQLWQDYIKITPQAAKIRAIFERPDAPVLNDHVAFRTFNISPISLDELEPLILGMGYRIGDEYHFEQKKLRAHSYLPLEAGQPRIFLSELLVDKLSDNAQAVIRDLCAQINPPADITGPEVFMKGTLWKAPSYEQYQSLLAESEYAAWMSIIGLRVNHFTVSINELKDYDDVAGVLATVEAHGFRVNEVGGRVKGGPAELLEQGSTMADHLPMVFANGDSHEVPTCFYEFAKRFPQADGELFQGFVAASADKIFESTFVGN